MKFNIIGFNSTVNYENKHCVIHPGTRLVQKLDEPDLLWCPQCGTSYSDKEAGTDEKIKSRFGPNNQTRIIRPKVKKKYYDSQGTEINDPDLIQEIQRGAHVISYQEFKTEDKNSATYIGNKRVLRKRD
jgi:hypothetical protein